MRELEPWVLGTQFVSTYALFGLIWFVQIVHYPLFLRIEAKGFGSFEAEHAQRTGYVAAPLMIAELLSSLLFLNAQLRPVALSFGQAKVGAALTVLTWVSTFVLQVPLHNRLHHGFDEPAIRRLVGTNWLRTTLWTVRAALLTSWFLRLAAL